MNAIEEIGAAGAKARERGASKGKGKSGEIWATANKQEEKVGTREGLAGRGLKSDLEY